MMKQKFQPLHNWFEMSHPTSVNFTDICGNIFKFYLGMAWIFIKFSARFSYFQKMGEGIERGKIESKD